MNRERIIELARNLWSGRSQSYDEIYSELESFAALIEAETIERCAAVCEKEGAEFFDGYEFQTPNGNELAAAIRSLK